MSGRQAHSLLEHVLSRVVVMPNGCWIWQGALKANGYGTIHRRGQMLYVHRISHEAAYGPIPPGMCGDHRCHSPAVCLAGDACPHRACVNPSHLAVVTPAESSARTTWAARTHCSYGHEFTEENTYNFRGARQCRVCRSLHTRRSAVAA